MAEPDMFHDKTDPNAHIRFHRWRQQHRRDGWYLNPKCSSEFKMHRATCPHLSNQYWDQGVKKPDGKSMTATKKICSTSRKELEDWARKEAAKRGKDSKIKRCPDC
jgi:hypothetical protein